jgi:hypothetical protein
MERTVHGAKRWIALPRDALSGRWKDLGSFSDISPLWILRGRRFKQSRHKTLADRLGVRERDVAWFAPRGHARSGAPSWFRRILRRRYRANMRHLLRTGQDHLLHSPPKDAGWYW